MDVFWGGKGAFWCGVGLVVGNVMGRGLLIRGLVHLRARSTRSGIGRDRRGKRPRESQGEEELKGFARGKEGLNFQVCLAQMGCS